MTPCRLVIAVDIEDIVPSIFRVVKEYKLRGRNYFQLKMLGPNKQPDGSWKVKII